MKINSLLKLSAWLWPPTVTVTETSYLMVTFITNTKKEIQSSKSEFMLKNGKRCVGALRRPQRHTATVLPFGVATP